MFRRSSKGDRRVEVEIGRGLNGVFNREEWLKGMIHSRMTLGCNLALDYMSGLFMEVYISYTVVMVELEIYW